MASSGLSAVGVGPAPGKRILLLALALLFAPFARLSVRFAPVASLALLAFLAPLYAQPPPPELTRPVNDFANILSPAAEAELERRILALKQASGDVVVVATVDTFEPYADIREYAVRMFENRGRGIGDKGKDNGLLVLIAVKNRRVQVEVGYDLEQFVTDGFAGDVSRIDMAPQFGRGDYDQGLIAGVTQLIGRIADGRGISLQGIPRVARPPETGTGIEISPWVIVLAIVLIILLMNSMGPRQRVSRGRTHWGGGPWSDWNSGVGPFGRGGGFGGGGFGGGFGGFGGGRSGGGGGGAGW
jgi:uncharacterized protein